MYKIVNGGKVFYELIILNLLKCEKNKKFHWLNQTYNVTNCSAKQLFTLNHFDLNKYFSKKCFLQNNDDGLVVSRLAFYSDDQSSNPAKVYSFIL